MKRKGSQIGIRRAHFLGDSAPEGIVVKLKKCHVWKETNAVNGTRHFIVIDIQLSQGRQTQELRRQAARQFIIIQIQKDKLGQHTNFRRNLAL